MSGIFIEDTEQNLLVTNATTDDIYNYQLVYGASDSTVTGAFMVSSFSITGGESDAQTFDATLDSSGTITYA